MFGKKSLSIKEKVSIFSKIRRGGPEARKGMEILFKQYDHLQFLRIYKSNNKNDILHAEDFLHDAFLVLRKNIIAKKVDPEININRYITSIAKNLIQNNTRKTSTYDAIENASIDENEIALHDYDPINKEEILNKVKELFSHVKPMCQQLLMLWAEGYSYKEIAKKLKFENESIARKNKFNCYNKLQEFLPQYQELKNYYL